MFNFLNHVQFVFLPSLHILKIYNVCCMFVAKRTGLAAAAVDIEDGAGEGWGDDADLVLDDGREKRVPLQ